MPALRGASAGDCEGELAGQQVQVDLSYDGSVVSRLHEPHRLIRAHQFRAP